MWTIGKIDHVVVWVRDLETSMAFYEALGFEINRKSLEEHRAGKIPFVAVKAGPDNQIDLRPNPNWIPVEREKGNMQHVNVVVDGIDDVKLAVQLCRRAGARARGELAHEGGYDPILGQLNRLKVHHLTLEFTTPGAGDVAVLRRLREDLEIGLG